MHSASLPVISYLISATQIIAKVIILDPYYLILFVFALRPHN